MGKRHKLTRDQYYTIRMHNDLLIAAAESGIQTYRQDRNVESPQFIRGQIAYWQNVIKGLKWSTKIAAQSAGVTVDA